MMPGEVTVWEMVLQQDHLRATLTTPSISVNGVTQTKFNGVYTGMCSDAGVSIFSFFGMCSSSTRTVSAPVDISELHA